MVCAKVKVAPVSTSWWRLGGGTIATLAMSLLLALVLVTIGGSPDQIRTRLHGLASHQMAGAVTTDKGFFGSPSFSFLLDQNLPPSPKRQPFGGKSVGTSLGHAQWTTLADCEVYAQSVRALFFQKVRSPLGVEAGGEDQCWAYALGKESGKCDSVNCWQAGTSKATSWSGGDVGLPIKVVGSADKVPPIAWTDVAACEAYATSNDAWYFQHADTNCYVYGAVKKVGTATIGAGLCGAECWMASSATKRRWDSMNVGPPLGNTPWSTGDGPNEACEVFAAGYGGKGRYFQHAGTNCYVYGEGAGSGACGADGFGCWVAKDA